MRILKKSEFKLMEQLFSLTDTQLKTVVTKYLKQKYDEVVETPDYVYAKGNIPIALTAHMDIVFAAPPTELFYDPCKGAVLAPGGLGADDRAGVFAIIQILRSGLLPHVIFTMDEESGCLGAGELSKIACPFDELKFIIELDRRGTCDCVFYDCENPDFVKYISSFGFIESYGIFTDICEICPSWGVAGVNLSVGYKDEHTTSEILFLEPLFATIEKVKNILKDKDSIAYKYIPSMSGYYYISNYWKNYGKFAYDSGTCVCGRCHQKFFEEEVFPVVMLDGSFQNICCDCVTKNIDWCSKCNTAYELTDSQIILKNFVCPKCKEKENA